MTEGTAYAFVFLFVFQPHSMMPSWLCAQELLPVLPSEPCQAHVLVFFSSLSTSKTISSGIIWIVNCVCPSLPLHCLPGNAVTLIFMGAFSRLCWGPNSGYLLVHLNQGISRKEATNPVNFLCYGSLSQAQKYPYMQLLFPTISISVQFTTSLCLSNASHYHKSLTSLPDIRCILVGWGGSTSGRTHASLWSPRFIKFWDPGAPGYHWVCRALGPLNSVGSDPNWKRKTTVGVETAPKRGERWRIVCKNRQNCHLLWHEMELVDLKKISQKEKNNCWLTWSCE